MTSRRGFTLLELVVSITVAGVIAVLVYGSAQAGFDTRERLARHRATTEAELRARTLLADAIRHASDEADPGVDAFALTDGMSASGLPADRLVFLSRGITPPLGASALWRVEVSVRPEGLRLDATRATTDGMGATSTTAVPTPFGTPLRAPVTALIPGIRGLDVQVMSLADREWGTTWRSTSQLPAAVRVVLHHGEGVASSAPLLVGVGLEGGR